MSTRAVGLILFLSIAASAGNAFAVDKDKRFRVNAASTYDRKQTQAGVTIAAVPYHTADLARLLSVR